MTIECIKYKSVNKGSLLGFADFYLPKLGMEIFGCALYQKDGKRWINLPTKEYEDDKGEVKYAPVIRFRDKNVYENFCKQAKEAIEKKCSETFAQQQQPSSASNEEIPF